jgi:cyanophycinase
MAAHIRRPGAVVWLATLLALAACYDNTNDNLRIIVSSGTVYEVPARDAPPVKPIPQRAGRGTMILEGGGVSVDAASELTVALAGNNPALCLIDTAQEGKGDPYHKFDKIGGLKMWTLNITARTADQGNVLEALRSCTGYYIDGGNPELLSTNLLRGTADTQALQIIRQRFQQKGAVVAGASAGAMIVGPVTLCECGSSSSVHALAEGRLYEAPGYRFVDGLLVDAHFFARGLIGRHLYALADTRLPVGVGIDESTAVVVPGDGGPWQVIGDSSVALIQRGSKATVDHLVGFTISLLNAGDRFDPHTGKITVAPTRKPVAIGNEPAAAPLQMTDIFGPDQLRQMILALVPAPSAVAQGISQKDGLAIELRKRSDTMAFADANSLSVLNLEVSAGNL